MTPEDQFLHKEDINDFINDLKSNADDTYLASLEEWAKLLDVPVDDIDFSPVELNNAIHEIATDIVALYKRRTPRNGLSKGKIAGIFAYRLSRCRIVHIVNFGSRLTDFLLQDLIACMIAIEYVVKLPLKHTRMLEMAYQLSRRHANQETLGLCFDILVDQYKDSDAHQEQNKRKAS